MIEILRGFPDNVIAAVARGHVSKSDYDNVLTPKVKDTLGRHNKIRCYYELGSEYSGLEAGAVWEDFKLGMENLPHWERIAIVTDVDWIRHATNVFQFLFSSQIRIFSTRDAAEARSWIAAQ